MKALTFTRVSIDYRWPNSLHNGSSNLHVPCIKLIFNRRAWGWCPLKVDGDSRASNEPWATSLEKGMQVSMATLQMTTTHQTHYTDQVSGETYQANNYQIHKWGREGEGETEAEQAYDSVKKQIVQPCTTFVNHSPGLWILLVFLPTFRVVYQLLVNSQLRLLHF